MSEYGATKRLCQNEWPALFDITPLVKLIFKFVPKMQIRQWVRQSSGKLQYDICSWMPKEDIDTEIHKAIIPPKKKRKTKFLKKKLLMMTSRIVAEQQAWWKALDNYDMCIWDLITISRTAQITVEDHQFCIWRMLCMFDAALDLNMQLNDFSLETKYDLLRLYSALVCLPDSSNWTLTRIMMYRDSRLNSCVMNMLSIPELCTQHVSAILLATFATISDQSQLTLLLTLLEIVTEESKLKIVTKLANSPTAYVATFCQSLQGVLESKCMLDAAPHINNIMRNITEHTHHFTLTIITNYPFAKWNNALTTDPSCVVRMPFRVRCKVHPLSKLVVGIYDNNCSLGGYKSRAFLLAFNQTSGDLVWGQPIHNNGMNKLIVNDTAVAVVPCEHYDFKEVYVYDLRSGRQTAMLIKPNTDSQLSPTMNTWTTRTYSNMICTDTVTQHIKFRCNERAPGKLKQFAFGVSLYHDNVLNVRCFSQNELEVRDCVACDIQDDWLAVVCLRDESMMLTLYKLRENGAHLHHMWMVPFLLQDVKFIALDARGAVLQHQDGLFFVNFHTPHNTNVVLTIPSWVHMRANFDTVWIWDRTTKQLTNVTPQGVKNVANVSHMSDMAYVDEQNVFVL